jgi:tetratricopeptide (TPR) repeat protein
VWRGRYHLNRGTREDVEKARRLFERAIEIDPRLPAPYAYIGRTYILELWNGWSTDATLLDKAEDLGRRAVELDVWRPEGEGHMTLALVNLARGRPDEAIVETERALEIVPNDHFAYATLALALAQQGRLLEAARSIKRALRLEPRPSRFLLLVAAYVNAGAGRRTEAIEQLERVRLKYPDNVIARVSLAAYYEQAGRHAEAADVVDEILRVAPDLTAERATRLIPGWETVVGAEEFVRYPGYLRAAGLP